MALFFFILGICIIIFAIFCFIYTAFCNYWDEEAWFFVGLISVIIGITMSVIAGSYLCDDKPVSPKTEETMRNETTDSLGVITEKDSVYAIRFIIYGKEDNWINVGGGIVLEGYTTQSIGDTITVNLK